MKDDFGIQRKFHSKRTQQRRFRVFLYFLCVIAALSLLVYGIFFSGFFDVGEVSVSGMQAVAANDIRQKILDRMVSPHLFSISGRNIFLFSPDDAEAILTKNYPRIGSVSVSRNFFTRNIMVSVMERAASGVACDPQNTCFLFTAGGLMFADATGTDPSLPLVKEDSFGPVSLPRQEIAPHIVKFISDIKEYARDFAGVSIQSFSLMNQYGDIEADTAGGYHVYFTDSYDAEKQARVLKNLLISQIKDQAQHLEYIDLRVENRAYYK